MANDDPLTPASTVTNQEQDPDDHSYVEMAQSFDENHRRRRNSCSRLPRLKPAKHLHNASWGSSRIAHRDGGVPDMGSQRNSAGVAF
jgi:hypothetical protein